MEDDVTASAGTTFAVVSDQATLAGQLYAARMRPSGDDADSDNDGTAPLPAEPVLQRLTLVRSDAVLEALAQSPVKSSSKAEVLDSEPGAEGKRKVRRITLSLIEVQKLLADIPCENIVCWSFIVSGKWSCS